MVMYDAFISYNHSKDRMVATRLQRLMQRLGKPWYQRRAMRVFRDDTSLSATPHLWPSIEEALEASRYLVLIASPEAAASRWVTQETQFWIENKSADTLLLALTAGELAWDPVSNDFAWSDATPLPSSLKGRFAHEPKWIDLRAFRDATRGSTEELFAAADLAAAIRGIPKEDLLSEEVRQHRRAMMLSGSAAVCLLLLSVAATWQWREAVAQRQEAVAQRDRAEKTLGRTIESANDLVLDVAMRLRRTLGVPKAIVDDLLKKVGDLQENLLTDNAASTNLRRARAVTLRAQSQALFAEAKYTEALAKAQQSNAIVRDLLKASADDAVLKFELSHSLDREGEAEAQLKHHAEALAAFDQALQIRLALALLPSGDTARAEAQQRDIAVTLERVGDEAFALDLRDKAAESYRDGLKRRQDLVRAKPDDPDAKEDLAAGYDRIARIDEAMGSGDPVADFRQSIGIREDLAKRDPLNAYWQDGLATDYANVGRILIGAGADDAASDALQKAIVIRRILASYPDVPKWQFDLAATLFYLAQCRNQTVEDRQLQLRQALGVLDKLDGTRAPLPNLAALRKAVQSELNALSQ